MSLGSRWEYRGGARIQIVTIWSQIEKNIIEFNLNLDDEDSEARKRFASFSRWYYHPGLDLFGPSKFIGYQDTTHYNYFGNGSGGITQNALKPFFNPIPFDSKEYQYYLDKLLSFAELNNLKISQKTLKGKYGGLYLPKNSYSKDDELENLIEMDSKRLVQEDGLYLEGKEGKKNTIELTRYERNPKLRRLAIQIHGTKCVVCNFDFETFYGLRGKGYIEVHHLTPLATMEKEQIVNPKTDLVTICSNCHRMIHRFKDKMLSVAELKKFIRMQGKLRK